MVSGWLVFFGLAAAYAVVVLVVSRVAKPGGSVDLAGPLLLLRTKRGIGGLTWLARGRRFWAATGDLFLLLTIVAGFAILALLVYQDILLIQELQFFRDNPPAPREALAIPGVNPFIPIGFGLFALLVALVVHEGGHAVLALAQHLRVKSLGLLIFIVPVGAFVEPDDRELQAAPLRAKLRMFAGGPGPNIVLAAVCVVLFAMVLMPSLEPAHEGVLVESVTEGFPAARAGVEPGMFITAIGGVPTPTFGAFQDALNQTASGRDVAVDVWQDGESRELTLVPMDRGAYYRNLDSPAAEELYRPWCDGKAFLGVGPSGTDWPRTGTLSLPDTLAHPFNAGRVDDPATVTVGCRVLEPLGPDVRAGIFLYFALPVLRLSPFPDTVKEAMVPAGVFEGLGDAFWLLADGLFWIFWINILLGTFNALPAGPLDGGHMFRHALHHLFRRGQGVPDSAVRVVGGDGDPVRFEAADPAYAAAVGRVNARVRLTTRIVGFSLLALLLAPLIVPRIL